MVSLQIAYRLGGIQLHLSEICKDEALVQLCSVLDDWSSATRGFMATEKLKCVQGNRRNEPFNLIGLGPWDWKDWLVVQSLVRKFLARKCDECNDDAHVGMKIMLHLEHCLASEKPWETAWWEHFLRLESDIRGDIHNVTALGDYMQRSGVLLKIYGFESGTQLHVRSTGMRRGRVNEWPEDCDAIAILRASSRRSFVFSDMESEIDIVSSATCKSDKFSDAKSHTQIALDFLEDALALHRSYSELHSDHLQSYCNQAQEWEPEQNSNASSIKTDLLQALTIEKSILYAPYDADSHGLHETHRAFERAFGPFSEGP